MKRIEFYSLDDLSVIPVLITERAMRRTAENYLNTHSHNASGRRGIGDYINKNGLVEKSTLGKIYVNFDLHDSSIFIERSCDYFPYYL